MIRRIKQPAMFFLLSFDLEFARMSLCCSWEVSYADSYLIQKMTHPRNIVAARLSGTPKTKESVPERRDLANLIT